MRHRLPPQLALGELLTEIDVSLKWVDFALGELSSESIDHQIHLHGLASTNRLPITRPATCLAPNLCQTYFVRIQGL